MAKNKSKKSFADQLAGYPKHFEAGGAADVIPGYDSTGHPTPASAPSAPTPVMAPRSSAISVMPTAISKSPYTTNSAAGNSSGDYVAPTTSSWGNLNALPGYSREAQEQAFNLDLKPQQGQITQNNTASQNFINQLQNQASGLAPSLTNAQMKAASERNLAAQLSMAAGARGQGVAAANRNAAYNQAALGQELVQQTGQAGLAEQLQNQQLINAQMGLQQQNVGQGMSAAQAMQQAQQNYMQYVTQQQEAAAGHEASIQQQGLANQGQLQSTRAGSIVGQVGSIFSGAGNFIGGLFKDGGVIHAANGYSIPGIAPVGSVPAVSPASAPETTKLPLKNNPAGSDSVPSAVNSAIDAYSNAKKLYDYMYGPSKEQRAVTNFTNADAKDLTNMSDKGTLATNGIDSSILSESKGMANLGDYGINAAHDGKIMKASDGNLAEFGLDMKGDPIKVITPGKVPDAMSQILGMVSSLISMKDGGTVPKPKSFVESISQIRPAGSYTDVLSARLKLKKMKGEV